MKISAPICDFVNRYIQKDFSRFHMPGHKGENLLGFEKYDITEIRGADSLYEAEGIIAQSEENARKIFNFGKTVYSTEGSSQCIKAMVYLAKKFAPNVSRPYILSARNSHKTFMYACALLDIDISWIYSSSENTSLCSCKITPQDIQNFLENAQEKPIAVYITAPDYLGYSPDIEGIASVCKKENIPLLVDNAHGAYLKFLPKSVHPIDLGASMSCDSAHKTLPVLTGGAYLQFSEKWAELAENEVKKAMEIFGSTSPSYLILQSLDYCNTLLASDLPQKIQQTAQKTYILKEKLAQKGFRVEKSDPLKITLDTNSAGYSAYEISEILRRNKIECEFCDLDKIVLMVTPFNTDKDFERLSHVLLNIEVKPEIFDEKIIIPAAQQVMSVKSAVFAKSKLVKAEDSIGKICATPNVSCPPAVPIVASGEVITKEMVDILKKYNISHINIVCD